jgi:hypothetical protein
MDWEEMTQDAKVMNPEEFESKWPRIWFLHRNHVEKIRIEEANRKPYHRIGTYTTRTCGDGELQESEKVDGQCNKHIDTKPSRRTATSGEALVRWFLSGPLFY